MQAAVHAARDETARSGKGGTGPGARDRRPHRADARRHVRSAAARGRRPDRARGRSRAVSPSALRPGSRSRPAASPTAPGRRRVTCHRIGSRAGMTKPGCAFRTSVMCETNGFGSNANRAAASAARRSLTSVSSVAGVCVAPAHAIRLCFQNPASSRTSSKGSHPNARRRSLQLVEPVRIAVAEERERHVDRVAAGRPAAGGTVNRHRPALERGARRIVRPEREEEPQRAARPPSRAVEQRHRLRGDALAAAGEAEPLGRLRLDVHAIASHARGRPRCWRPSRDVRRHARRLRR